MCIRDREDIVNYYISIKAQYVGPIAFGLLAAISINFFLMLYLFIRNAHRVEKAMVPILNGIRHLSAGNPVCLEESGELAEISASLNKAGDYLLKKDNTRAEWIDVYKRQHMLSVLSIHRKYRILPGY